MAALAGFKLSNLLYEGEVVEVYSGIRESDNQAVTLKFLKNAHPSSAQKAYFTREYDILRSLEGEGTVPVYGMEPNEESLVIIMSQFGTCSLETFLARNTPSLPDTLEIMLNIADALDKLHEHGIIHKDVWPANILLDINTKQVKIVDFGISCTLYKEEPEIQDWHNLLEGALPYISPEQTGRMNRGVDYRSDYYSLGIVFYRMVTGQLPFQATDALGWVNCHIAQQPIAPHILKPTLSPMISNIILKLMAKTVEDRYQSLYGLKFDLRHCLNQLKTKKEITPFTIASQDISAKFSIPEILYGREQEVQQLLSTFDRVCHQGKAELMLVAGYSGVGKSRLIHELYKPITAKHAYFISGKCDQYQRNLPNFSMLQALNGLIQQILTEHDDAIQQWKKQILKAVGPNGQIIIDVLPSLETIIGQQPKVLQLEGKERQNRFENVFKNFVQAFATPDHPLVIFLDDLQWIDSAFLNLLQLLLSESNCSHLLILGAYRDNEVDATHPLMMTLTLLQKNQVPIESLQLKPLENNHVMQLLIDTLRSDEKCLENLAEICIEKTQGNPFFLTQFLLNLYHETIIKFDRQNGCWEWDTDKIREKSYSDNVVEFMSTKLHELKLETQEVLKMAACLGNYFDLNILSIVCQKSLPDTIKSLWEALEKGLILPTSDQYKYEIYKKDTEKSVSLYQFLHDRVQQAAYLLTPEQEQATVHLKIGRLLLEIMSKDSQEAIFNTANHMNKGISLINDPEEKIKLAELNLLAGQKAKTSIAYEMSFHYLKTGLSLMTVDAWEKQYPLMYALHSEIIEVAFLFGKITEMDEFIDITLKHARTVLDKARVYYLKITYLSVSGMYVEAIHVGLETLALFNVHLPKNPSTLQVIFAVLGMKMRLFGKSMASLKALPLNTDPNISTLTKILIALTPPTFVARPNLFVCIVAQLLRLTIKYGVSPESAYTFIIYAVIVMAKFNQINQSHLLGQLGVYLFYKLPPSQQNPRLIVPFYLFIENLNEARAPLVELAQKCMDAGDPEFFAYTQWLSILIDLFTGKNLTDLISQVKIFTSSVVKFKPAHQWGIMTLNAALALRGISATEMKAQGGEFPEKEWVASYLEANNLYSLGILYILKLQTNYLLGTPQELNEIKLGIARVENIMGTSYQQQAHYYGCLSYFSCYAHASTSQRKILKKHIRYSLRKMKFWSKYPLLECLHKYHLLNAEWARIRGKKELASEQYDLAIQLAHQHAFLQDESIANESAARFYFDLGKEKTARGYFEDAYVGYKEWGALAKVKQLKTEFPEILSKRQTVESVTPFSSTNMVVLDLATIMKATETISNVKLLPDVLRATLSVLMENMSAHKFCVLLEKEGEWQVEAESIIHTKGEIETHILESLPISDHVPTSIIQHVIHSRNFFLSNNLAQEKQFMMDPYFKTASPKSLLCLPLLSHNELFAILYLENNLVTYAFTQESLGLLKLLGGQIVISIENTKLYERLINFLT